VIETGFSEAKRGKGGKKKTSGTFPKKHKREKGKGKSPRLPPAVKRGGRKLTDLNKWQEGGEDLPLPAG